MAKAKKARSFEELTALLAEARKRSEADPRNEKSRELTERIVKLGERGVRLPEDPDAELSESQKELLSLKTERGALVTTIQEECNALIAERSSARRVERALAATALSDQYAGSETVELEKMLADVTSKQRGLKVQKRALRIVLDERARKRAAEEQIEKMSPEERREMLAMLQKSVDEG